MSVQSTLLQPNITRPRSSFKRALVVTRRELRDTLRDWRIVTPIVTLVIILPLLLALILSSASENLVHDLGRATFYDKVMPFTCLAIGFLPMSFCLVIALETFVGEKERNSLEALMSAPLTDLELFMGKYIAASLPTVLACTSASLAFGILVDSMGQPFPAPLDLFLVFLALNIVQGLVMVAGSVLVSTHTTSVRAANIMASFIILPMSIAVQAEAILILNNLRWGLYFLLIGLSVLLILLLRSGVKVFNREEIVSREGDNLTLKGVLRGFGYYFKRTPQEALARQKTGVRWTPWRFYRHDIPQIIKLDRGGILVVLIALAGAIAVGWWVSTWPEAQQILRRVGFEDEIATRRVSFCENASATFSGITWDWIFMNNVRSVLIASAISIITLGVAGIGMLMISVGPIGFLVNFLLKVNISPLPLLVGFILPHGIIELTAVIIAIAAALRMGNSVISPPPGMSIGQSVQFSIINYLKVMALVVPMLLIAAIIEANVTPTIGCWLTGGRL